MKPALFLLAVLPACAQISKPVAMTSPAPAIPCVMGPKVTPQSFTQLEGRFNSALASINDKDQADVFGPARALYLRDYGLTITAELSLVQTPGLTMFQKEIPASQKVSVHQRKLAQIPNLEKAMREMARASALTLAGPLGMTNYEGSGLQVVISVKLLYLPWEDTTDLPAQIVMKANLKNAIAGQLEKEVQ